MNAKEFYWTSLWIVPERYSTRWIVKDSKGDSLFIITLTAAAESVECSFDSIPVRSVLLDHFPDFVARNPWELMMNILHLDGIIDIDHASIFYTMNCSSICHNPFSKRDKKNVPGSGVFHEPGMGLINKQLTYRHGFFARHP
ncbi:MAG TPA: hypothetical protein VFT90_02870 [Chryseosolibacter sp.]|nr:hypothetical protein [Chryseosolibacter sp.]